MAKLIKANGTTQDTEPANGMRYTLEELQSYVGGLIEMIDLGEGYMVINEEGKLIGLPYNAEATKIARPVLFEFDAGVFGDVLVMSPVQAGD